MEELYTRLLARGLAGLAHAMEFDLHYCQDTKLPYNLCFLLSRAMSAAAFDAHASPLLFQYQLLDPGTALVKRAKLV